MSGPAKKDFIKEMKEVHSYISLKRYDKAKIHIRRMDLMAQTLNDPFSKSMLYFLKGEIYSGKKDLDAALDQFCQALDLFAELEPDIEVMELGKKVLADVSEILIFKCREDILKSIENVHDLVGCIPYRADLLISAIDLLEEASHCFLFCGQSKRCIHYLEKRVELAEKLIVKDECGYQRHLECMMDLIDLKPAGFIHAEQLYRKAGKHTYLMILYNELGKSYFFESDMETASQFFRKTVDIFSIIRSPDTSILSEAAVAYDHLGMIGNSSACYEELLRIYQALLRYEKPSREMWMRMAYVYGKLAQISHQDLLKYRSLQEDMLIQAGNMDTLGMFWTYMGDHFAKHQNNDRAIVYYEQALDVLSRPEDIGLVHFRIGLLFASLGDMEDSITHYDTSDQFFSRADSSFLEKDVYRQAYMQVLSALLRYYRKSDVHRSTLYARKLNLISKGTSMSKAGLRQMLVEGVSMVLNSNALTFNVHDYEKSVNNYSELVNEHRRDPPVLMKLGGSFVMIASILLREYPDIAKKYIDLADQVSRLLNYPEDLVQSVKMLKKSGLDRKKKL